MDSFTELSGLRVAFVAGTLGHGGAERQLFYILQALCQCGAAPRVLSLDEGQVWEPRIRALGVPVTCVGQRPSRIGRLMRMLRELRSTPPELVQSQHFFCNAYVACAGFVRRVSAIGAMRNEAAAELRNNSAVGGWLNLHTPPVIAANSRLAIKDAIAAGINAKRLFFLPNVVDTDRFRPAAGPGRSTVTLLAVGRVTRQKRFDRFIVALARLRAELGLEVRGWILGPTQDEELRRQLEEQAAQLGLLHGCLEFLGDCSEVVATYRQADMCVLTSDYEGTPNVLLEAMASGLPVVATKVGGVPDIVRHGTTGLLVDREDPAGLVAALVQLAANVPRRKEMGIRAREYVEEHHSLERLPAYLANLYRLALPSWRLGEARVAAGTPA